MPTCAVLSFRLGGTDGVSVVAATWIDALRAFGFDVVTVAGEGPVDRLVPDLAIGRWPDGLAGVEGPGAATPAEVDALADDVRTALADADLVVVENLGTIPMNLPAARAVARARAGRPTLWHHHDPAWQRDRYAGLDELPPDDPAWRHVTINDLTRDQLRERGIDAVDHPQRLRRARRARRPGGRAGPASGWRPTSSSSSTRCGPSSARTSPPPSRLAEALGATYWLTGPAEEGYGADARRRAAGPPVAGVRGAARARRPRRPTCTPRPTSSPSRRPGRASATRRSRPPSTAGRPRSATTRSPRSCGPSASSGSTPPTRRRSPRGWPHPDEGLLDRNAAVARRHLSLEAMADSLRALLDEAGWSP